MFRFGLLATLFYLPVSFADPVPEVKIALLGDTGAGRNFEKALELSVAEAADVIMINGDLGYSKVPRLWARKVREKVDLNKVAVIGALGNHDFERGRAKDYIKIFGSFRNDQNNLALKCSGGGALVPGKDVIAIDEVCEFRNVTVIPSAIGQLYNLSYFEERLESKLSKVASGQWKLVGYHYTLASMNPGLKGDQNSHGFFDIIRKYGALGAQAHTHSVMASCPISSTFEHKAEIHCHPDYQRGSEERFLLPGTGLFVDSSLGGKGARKRRRCFTPDAPGCDHMMDLITKRGYTHVNGKRLDGFKDTGVMFVTYNVGGNSDLAHVYFKSIDGTQVFQFEIRR